MSTLKALFAASALVAAALWSGHAQAQDASTLSIIGFSADGKYLAFEQYGTQDGSGFPFSQIQFVEVDANVLAAPSVHVVLQDGSEELGPIAEAKARKKARSLAKKTLKKLGIAEGNEGQMLAARLITDFDGRYADEVRVGIYPGGDWANLGIRLEQTEATETDSCWGGPGGSLLTVNLDFFMNPHEPASSTRVIQKDTKLPSWRTCAFDYSIANIVLYDSNPGYWGDDKTYKLVTFVWVKSPGFEGPDHRLMAVTTAFQFPL